MRFTEQPLPPVTPPQHAVDFLKYQSPEPSEPLEPPRRARRSCLFFILFLLLLSVGCVSFIVRGFGNDTSGVTYREVTLEPQAPQGFFSRLKQLVFHDGASLAGQKEDRINILLLGMGGPGHDGPYLTDTIIIASIKPSTGQVAMTSIPRDLWVNVSGYGWNKINHVNSFGETKRPGWGAAFAAEMIKDNFGLDIHYYVRVDFKAFEEIIDEVGGIRVNVERSFTDPQYPTANNGVETISFTKGAQVMSGNRALKYARSRHGNNGEGSDFARAKRQQKMLLAFKEKVVSFSTLSNPVRVQNIMESLDSHITTNLTFPEMVEFAKLGQALDTSHIIHQIFDNSEGGYLVQSFSSDGQYILAPRTGNFEEISDVMNRVFDIATPVANDTPAQDAPAAFTSANIEIQNGTWRAGLAARLKRTLTEKQFVVTGVGNTLDRPLAASAIYTVRPGVPSDTVTALSSELGLPIYGTLPPTFTVQTSTDILVVIGDDTTIE